MPERRGIPKNWKPSPPVNRTYAGPDVPVSYDPNWQLYNNLTKEQVAWFQAQPEWANFLDYVALSPKTATIAVPPAVVSAALAVSKSKL